MIKYFFVHTLIHRRQRDVRQHSFPLYLILEPKKKNLKKLILKKYLLIYGWFCQQPRHINKQHTRIVFLSNKNQKKTIHLSEKTFNLSEKTFNLSEI